MSVMHDYLHRNEAAYEQFLEAADIIERFNAIKNTRWYKNLHTYAAGERKYDEFISGTIGDLHLVDDSYKILEIKESCMQLQQFITKVETELLSAQNNKGMKTKVMYKDKDYEISVDNCGLIRLIEHSNGVKTKPITILDLIKTELSKAKTSKSPLHSDARIQLGMALLDLKYREECIQAMAKDLQSVKDGYNLLKSRLTDAVSLKNKLRAKYINMIYICIILGILTTCSMSFTLWLGHQAQNLSVKVHSPQ